eukprot:scaffold335464_cov39-Prasinocladus_malaysianus.AAC.1
MARRLTQQSIKSRAKRTNNRALPTTATIMMAMDGMASPLGGGDGMGVAAGVGVSSAMTSLPVGTQSPPGDISQPPEHSPQVSPVHRWHDKPNNE